jgi:hypothetical protein
MERMEETEEDVLLRPRRPDERRYDDDRGVRGEGESERRLDPVPAAPMAGVLEPECER